MRDTEAILKALRDLTRAVEHLNKVVEKGLEGIAQEISELKVAAEMKG
jgi:uncharacterized protein Yka (UPF0111/DUF47 family)